MSHQELAHTLSLQHLQELFVHTKRPFAHDQHAHACPAAFKLVVVFCRVLFHDIRWRLCQPNTPTTLSYWALWERATTRHLLHAHTVQHTQLSAITPTMLQLSWAKDIARHEGRMPYTCIEPSMLAMEDCGASRDWDRALSHQEVAHTQSLRKKSLRITNTLDD